MALFIPYESRLAEATGELTYLELLLTTEWRTKRNEIINRDNYKCSACRKGETIMWWNESSKCMKPHFVRIPADCRRFTNTYMENGEPKTFPIFDTRQMEFIPAEKSSRLHVHHTCYVEGRKPWQYSNKLLQTMCEDCHYSFHQQHRVKVYRQTPNGLVEIENLTPCLRCASSGILPEFDHVQGGICFRCWGACFEEWITAAGKFRNKLILN